MTSRRGAYRVDPLGYKKRESTGHKPIPTWQQRLDAMDHTKGTSNTMRENCMKAEILELRAALRRQKVQTEQQKERATQWRLTANRYQKMAAENAAKLLKQSPNNSKRTA